MDPQVYHGMNYLAMNPQVYHGMNYRAGVQLIHCFIMAWTVV